MPLSHIYFNFFYIFKPVRMGFQNKIYLFALFTMKSKKDIIKKMLRNIMSILRSLHAKYH